MCLQDLFMWTLEQRHYGPRSDSLSFFGELTSPSQIPYIFLKIVLEVEVSLSHSKYDIFSVS